jgi:hypothetical protein
MTSGRNRAAWRRQAGRYTQRAGIAGRSRESMTATPTCCTTSAWHGARSRSRCRRRATGLPDPSLHRHQNGWEPIAITVGSKSSSIRSRSSHDSDQTCRPSVADHHRPDGVALNTSRTGEQAEPTPTAATTQPPTTPESDRRPWSHTPAPNHATTSQALPPIDLCIVVTAGEEGLGRGVLVG